MDLPDPGIETGSPAFQADSLPTELSGGICFFSYCMLFLSLREYCNFNIISSFESILPVQVRCTILDAWGWCTGKTQRDGMGREEGGGFRMGNTCIPVVDSF